MAKRSLKPWFRKGRGWHVWHNGRLHNLGVEERSNYAAALEEWRLLCAGVAEVEEPSASGPTVAEVGAAYLKALRLRRGDAHFRSSYSRLMRVDAVLGQRGASGLASRDVETLLEHYPRWSATTRRNVLATLAMVLRWASRPGGMLAANPLPRIDLPRAAVRTECPEADQVAALLLAARYSLRRILWALASTGARPGELRAARPGHVDRDGSAIRLPTSKTNRPRAIWFPADCRARLKLWARVEPDWLFPAPEGGQWGQHELCAAVAEARDRAGLPRWLTAYSLRHAWITERLRAGESAALVARLAGTSVAMIDRTYGHLADADARRAADRL